MPIDNCSTKNVIVISNLNYTEYTCSRNLSEHMAEIKNPKPSPKLWPKSETLAEIRNSGRNFA